MNNILTTSPYIDGIANTGASIGGPFGKVGRIVSDADRVSLKELDSEVFQLSVENLINIWITRYGNEWVDLVAVELEPFYLLVYKRLRSLGELEQHFLTDRSRFVCRKPE